MENLRKIAASIMILMGAGLMSVNAQSEIKTDKYHVETNKFWNNCFISVGGGAQVYIGDGDNQGSFGKRIAPALDVAIGKWFTPGLGLRFEYSGLQAKAFGYTPGDYATGAKDSKGVYKQKWNMAHFHGDVLFNVSNMFCGYNETRVYNLIPYIGFGVMHSWDKPKTNELAATVGLINRFRLSSALDLNLEAKGTLVNDRFDSEIGGKGKEGLASVTLGLTYRFKQRGWSHGSTRVVSTGISEDDMKRLREQMNDMQRNNQALKEELEAARNKKPETIMKKEFAVAPRIIIFPLGKSTLSKQERVNLGYYAKLIKEAPADKVFTVIGYADNKTGSEAVNERLSKARAEAVRDALVNEFGVKDAQLKTSYKGGVDNMYYDDAALSRAVIVE